MIEMPVLFWNPPDPQGRIDLVAFTNNVVNSLVDGNTLFIPRTWGPKVMPNNEDLFAYYSREAAKKVGFVTVTASEERVYHNNSGSIHCGTNVLRQIPDVDADKWWKNL